MNNNKVENDKVGLEDDADKVSLEEDTDKVNRIHDTIAQYWNWAYYNEPYPSEASWLLGECMKSIKSDIEPRAMATLFEVEEFMKEHPQSFLSILDVGCGPGGFINKTIAHFSEKHPQMKLSICGLDISKEMITYAKQHVKDPNVELLCETITNPTLKLKREPFDLATMVFILCWYNDENARKILEATRQKLRPNGTLILMDFSRSYAPWKGLNFYSKTMDKMADMMWTGVLGEQFHLHKRVPKQLEALLKDAGFEMVTCYPTEKIGIKKGMLVIRATAKSPELSVRIGTEQENYLIETEKQ